MLTSALGSLSLETGMYINNSCSALPTSGWEIWFIYLSWDSGSGPEISFFSAALFFSNQQHCCTESARMEDYLWLITASRHLHEAVHLQRFGKIIAQDNLGFCRQALWICSPQQYLWQILCKMARSSAICECYLALFGRFDRDWIFPVFKQDWFSDSTNILKNTHCLSTRDDTISMVWRTFDREVVHQFPNMKSKKSKTLLVGEWLINLAGGNHFWHQRNECVSTVLILMINQDLVQQHPAVLK